jgi:hypothetical protein
MPNRHPAGTPKAGPVAGGRFAPDTSGRTGLTAPGTPPVPNPFQDAPQPPDTAAQLLQAARSQLRALAEADPIAFHKLVQSQQRAIADAAYPRLTRTPSTYTDEDGEVPGALTCPHCRKETAIVVVDHSERWTEVEEENLDDQSQTFGVDYDGDGDYDHAWYQSSCCNKPVRLPDGWAEE